MENWRTVFSTPEIIKFVVFPPTYKLFFYSLQPSFAQYQTICKFERLLVALSYFFATIILIIVNFVSVIIYAYCCTLWFVFIMKILTPFLFNKKRLQMKCIVFVLV